MSYTLTLSEKDLLDDWVQELVQQKVKEFDVAKLQNHQLRKFWDGLRTTRQPYEVRRTAIHQQRKATKELHEQREKIQGANKNRRNPGQDDEEQQKKLNNLEAKLAPIKAREDFWKMIEQLVDKDRFEKRVRKQFPQTGKKLNDQGILELQLVFAESLYSECIFQKGSDK